MSGVNSTNIVDNIPPGETLQSGWTKFNAHYHEYDAATLTNRCGLSLSVGDVVALDVDEDESVALHDTAGTVRVFVVPQATIAAEQAGEFARSGIATVKVTGAVTRGNYLIKSATARALEDSGVSHTGGYMPEGTIGIALQAAAGPGTATISANLFGFTFAPGDRSVVLDRVASGSDVTLTAIETSVYTHSVEANSLGLDRQLRFLLYVDALNNTGVTRTLTIRLKYGGTTALTWTISLTTSVSRQSIVAWGSLSSAGTPSGQTAAGTAMLSTDVNGTSVITNAVYISGHNAIAVDSTVAQTLALTFELSTSSASLAARIRSLVLERTPSRA